MMWKFFFIERFFLNLYIGVKMHASEAIGCQMMDLLVSKHLSSGGKNFSFKGKVVTSFDNFRRKIDFKEVRKSCIN